MLLRASCRVAARSYVAAGVALMSLPAAAADEPVLKFTTDLKSDSIDRGITQTAHRPGVTSGVDLQKNWLYVTTEISSVKLPANPAAEVALGAGLRPTLPGFENVDIDIGVVRYLYPGATPVDASGSGAYTEAEVSVSIKLGRWTVGGEIAYSPDYNNTGARTVHTAANIKFELPKAGWMPFDSYYLWSEFGH